MAEKEKTKVETPNTEEFQGVSIKKHDEKPAFWKPKKVGEAVEGRLVAIIEGKYGEVLRISTGKGTVSITVNFFLADIDFQKYVGQALRFTFKGEVGRKGRVYDVDKVADEVPF